MANLKTHYENGTLVVEFFSTSVLAPGEIDSVETELLKVADRSASSRIVVDLQNLEFMSSALIGAFIRFRMRVRKNGSELKLCNASDDLAELLQVTKLDKVFDIHDTRAAAVEAFQYKTS